MYQVVGHKKRVFDIISVSKFQLKMKMHVFFLQTHKNTIGKPLQCICYSFPGAVNCTNRCHKKTPHCTIINENWCDMRNLPTLTAQSKLSLIINL